MYQKLAETKSVIDKGVEYGKSVHTKCKETDDLFAYTEEVRTHILRDEVDVVKYHQKVKDDFAAVPPSRPPSPPPPPPAMYDISIQKDPPPGQPPPAPPPPPVLTRGTTQTTPPPTPLPSQDAYTDATVAMSDKYTITDHRFVRPTVNSIARRIQVENQRAITGEPAPFRPYGKPVPRDDMYFMPLSLNRRGSASSISSGSLSPDTVRRVVNPASPAKKHWSIVRSAISGKSSGSTKLTTANVTSANTRSPSCPRSPANP